MTPEQLDKIEKLADAATPGPWSQEVWQGNANTGGWAAVGPHQESTDCICESEEDREECAGEYCADERSQNDEEQAWKDAAFIRAMREYAMPLVKAVREARVLNPPNGYFEDIDRLTKERDEARAEVEQLKSGRDYDAKVIPDLVRELEEAKLLLSVQIGTVEAQRQLLADNGVLLLKATAEVERLREVVRKVHAVSEEALSIKATTNWTFGQIANAFREIYRLTKEKAEP